jgi:dUTP pyrophosphatase
MKKIFEETYQIEVEVLLGGALPCKAHASDAGFDVFATEDVVIYPGDIIKHPLNIRLKLPIGSWARIETKSGLGSKGMLVFAGVVDREYRGIPHVIATNLRSSCRLPICIKKGEKIAQITMNPHSESYYIVEVDSVDTATERSDGGFGSSGV